MAIIKSLTLIYLIAISFFSNANNIKSEVDSTKFRENENIKLTISLIAEDKKDNLSVKQIKNLTKLNKDFKIVSRSVSTSTIITNGKISQSNKLILYLIPKDKQKKNLIIPSFSYKNQTTKPIKIEIVPAGNNFSKDNSKSSNKNVDNKIEILTQISNKPYYLYGQILYKIIFRTPIAVANLSIDTLNINNAKTRVLKDKQYSTNINGINYEVVERSYLIFPEKIGSLVIPSQTITVGLSSSKGSTDFFGLFGFTDPREQKFYSTSKKEIKILPPVNDLNPWLVSNNISISQTISKEQVNLGDAFWQQIEIVIEGMIPDHISNSLIDFDKVKINGLNVYPEQTEKKEIILNNKLFTKLTKKINFLPTNVGSFNLKPITVKWWNLSSKKIQTSKTQEINFKVVDNQKLIKQNDYIQKPQINNQKELKQELKINYKQIIFWIIAIVLFSLLLFGFIYWNRKRLKIKKQLNYKHHNLAIAMQENDLKKIYQTLIEFLEFKLNLTINNNSELSKIINQTKMNNKQNWLNFIELLNKNLYSRKQHVNKIENNELSILVKSIKTIKVDNKKTKNINDKTQLKDLYPK